VSSLGGSGIELVPRTGGGSGTLVGSILSTSIDIKDGDGKNGVPKSYAGGSLDSVEVGMMISAVNGTSVEGCSHHVVIKTFAYR